MALIIRIFKPKIIIVQTASIFNLLSMFAIEVSSRLKIQTYCWMHGGYGAYTSLPGFDVTDFYSISNHLVYGRGAADSILSKNSILRILYPKTIYKAIIAGSPHLQNTYSRIDCTRFNNRKIVFALAGPYYTNSYYVGYDRDYDFLNFEQCIHAISGALQKFSDKFEIIIKDYPDRPYRELFNNPNRSQLYVSDEMSFQECISDAGAIILPWVSTSFIEGVMTRANIILYDNSQMNNESSRILAEECFMFESDLDLFCKKLEKCLLNIDASDGFQMSDNHIIRSYFVESVEACLDNYSKLLSN